MTLQELYELIGGDYQGALGRLRSEGLVRMLVLKVPSDPAFSGVQSAWAAGDRAAAFDAAHTAKGVCGSLSLTSLGSCATELTDALREGSPTAPDAEALVARFGDLYARTVRYIQDYAAS